MDKPIKIQLKPQFDFDSECKTVEVEMLDFTNEIDARLDEIECQIDDLDVSIDKLTNHADKLDCSVSIVSGILAGIIDALFIGKFDLQEGRNWSSEKINEFVINVAKKEGYEGNDLQGAIRHLEKFGAPSDSVYNDFGGALQHHLRDFAHHASPVGLVFSMLTQFTKKAYGTKPDGTFHVVPIDDITYIGDTIPTKITFGLIYWILHMASDMAGSSGTPGTGTGVPGPILSIVKLLSAMPIFNNEGQVNELSLKVSKLFNGTLLAERDSNGKILKDIDGKPIIHQMDLRGELGILQQFGKQALPVIINEAFVRGFYFINRFVDEIKVKKSIKEVEWSKTIPFGNRTIERMMTIATGTFSAIDTLDAVIEGAANSKANWAEFGRQVVLRLNFVGIGRFTIALGTDTVMELRKGKQSRERMLLKAESLCLLEAKMYYGDKLMWSALKDANQSIDSLFEAMQQVSVQISEDIKAIQTNTQKIQNTDINRIEEHNKGLTAELSDIL
ncbi:MAG: hypothetical protein ACI4MS_07825 [Candidatus Coproplasma sp.]